MTFPFETIGFFLKSFEDASGQASGTSFGEISDNSTAPGDEAPFADELGDR